VIEKDQPWGVRKLAYEIKKRQDGYYHVLEFRSPQTALPASLGTFIRTQPGVLRHMIIRVPKAKLLQEQRDAAEAARREKQAPPKPEPPQAAPSETGKPSAVEPATIESSPTEETSGPTSEPEVEETQSPEAQHEQPSWLETDEEGMQAEVEPDDAPDAPTR
jgi:ribosomal protein S6